MATVDPGCSGFQEKIQEAKGRSDTDVCKQMMSVILATQFLGSLLVLSTLTASWRNLYC